MHKHIQTEWADRLDSGEDHQGKGIMRRVDPDDATVEVCCLGVLTQQAIDAGVPGLRINAGGQFEWQNGEGKWYVEDATLPPPVQVWADCASNPLVGGRAATMLNDADHLTFAEIAAEIRHEGVQ